MRYEWEIIRDWHDVNGFFPDEENESEFFVGTNEELDNRLRELRECGCTNIFFNLLGEVSEAEEAEEDPYGDDWEEYVDPWEKEYIRSVTGGDYSSANPWDAPGMSVSDFI